MTVTGGGQDRAIRLLGLARRAGKVALGQTAVVEALEGQRASLILVAKDASERTQRTFRKLAGRQGVPLVILETKFSLGQMLGTVPKAVCAVCDDSFASGIGRALGLVDF